MNAHSLGSLSVAVALSLVSAAMAGCGAAVTSVDGGDAAPTVDAGACQVIRALTLPMDRAMGSLPGRSAIRAAICAGGGGGAVAMQDVYSLRVSARTGLDLRTEVPQGVDSVLSVRRVCDAPASEVACNDDAGPIGPSRIRRMLEPGDYFVVVGRFGAGANAAPGAYTLDVSSFEPAANASCAGAQRVTSGARLTGQSLGGAAEPSTACGMGDQSNVLHYAVTVPPGQTLRVAATMTSGMGTSPTVRVVEGCAGAVCLAQSQFGGTDRTTETYFTNRGATPTEAIVVVGSGGRGPTSDTFDLAVDVLPPPPNAMCASATAMSDGTMLTLQNAILAIDSLTAACLPMAAGPALYYRATIPPGELLRAIATPHGNFTPVIRVLPACGATSCIASVARGFGDAQVLSHYNGGGAPLDVIIAVGSAQAMMTGLFDLAVSIRPPSYTETVGTAACDDVTAATPVPNVANDDTVSPVLPLPFAFRYFGDTATHFAVSSNGFMHLFASATGMPSQSFMNDVIPRPDGPNGFVAAFWDDLVRPMGDTTPAAVSQLFGAAPDRRFTVQWTEMRFLGDQSARLTFQAQLHERASAVELHYCALSSTAAMGNHTGAGATIGIESLTGTDGFLHSVDIPMAVSTGLSLRYVPRTP